MTRVWTAPLLRDGLTAGGAPRMWAHVVRQMLPSMTAAAPSGSSVLEVGYGDGQLSCWLASTLGWRMTGLDIHTNGQEVARASAQRHGVTDRVQFLLTKPSETRHHTGRYDAVFIKTVLYSSETLAEYADWLDWIRSVLRPGGSLINFETGRASRLVRIYRELRRRPYRDLCLYNRDIERLYDQRFDVRSRQYYGGVSQFLSPLHGVFETTALLERMCVPPSADNCFVAAMVMTKPTIDRAPRSWETNTGV